MKMKIHKEMSQILCLVERFSELVKKLDKKIDASGVLFETAKLVELTDEQIKKYADPPNNDYLVEQYNPYEDDYYGYLYFATKEKNKFIRVEYSC